MKVSNEQFQLEVDLESKSIKKQKVDRNKGLFNSVLSLSGAAQ
jgi:hypothetical protein